MSVAATFLESLRDEKIYGYGAANLLPVLAYHKDTDLGYLEAVLDDDPAKSGLFYGNMPVQIRPSSEITDLADATVLISTPDSVQPILTLRHSIGVPVSLFSWNAPH